MRVIIPYTRVDGNVRTCCEAAGIEPEMHDVSGDPLDYWRVMCRAWADQEDFILLEHDVQFEPEAITLLEACRGVWCSAGPYFQLCRFRSELMRAIPDAVERIPHLERHWMTLEQSFAGRLAVDLRLTPLRGSHGVHNHCGEVHVFNPGAHASHGALEYQLWYRREELSRKIAEGAPCDREYCKRGHRGRDQCPNCVDNPLIVIRDSDGTLRGVDGRLATPAELKAAGFR